MLSVVIIGLNLRPLLTSATPLLPILKAQLRLAPLIVSLLTALPVFMMGVMALLAKPLLRAFSPTQLVSGGLLVLMGSCLWRWHLDSGATLLFSALLGGAGIGIIQAVMPAIIRQRFLRVAAVTGLWSGAIMGGGGVAAAVSPWLAQQLDWRLALTAWAMLAAFARMAWSLHRHPQVATTTDDVTAPRDRAPWLLGFYFGAINGGYASAIAWLPDSYQQLGWSAQQGGSLLALLTVGQVVGAIVLPLLARGIDRRPLLWLALALQLFGFSGLLLAPLVQPWIWALSAGIGLGGAFPLCLVLALDQQPSPERGARRVALMQGFGFILAGIMPFATGLMHTFSGSYTLGWGWHVLLIVALILMTTRFAPATEARQVAVA
ncbi:cyanate transporter [Enterobacterales bacterium CwR94]|nr:cyanate transporter [Enterobacterales bacterium CwR94]